VWPVQPQPGKPRDCRCRPPQAGPGGLLEPSVRVACGRPVRSRYAACASAIAVAVVRLRGVAMALFWL